MQKNYSVELKNYSVVCIKKHTPYNNKMENNKQYTVGTIPKSNKKNC